MGSDHRAVRTRFDIVGTRYWEKQVIPKIKGWKPRLNHDGIPKQFQDAVVDQCIDKDTCKPEILESILHEAAISPNVSEPSRYRSKLWDEPEVQDLLRKRREAATPIQRKT